MAQLSSPDSLRRSKREVILTYRQKAQRLGAVALFGLLTACSGGATGSGTIETNTPTSAPTATITPSPTESPTAIVTATQTTELSTDRQEVEQFGAYTFDNYQNASGMQQFLPIGSTVIARCLIYDPNSTVTTTHGLWYRLDSPEGPNNETLYAPANTFWNQVPPQPPDQKHPYDQQLAMCPDSPSQTPPSP